MRRMLICCIIAAVISVFSASAEAGVYSDDLSRCLVESSTASDKLILVKWMFTSISLHPAVKSIASVSATQVDKSNKDMADLTVKLVTETCRDEARKALKYEGNAALQSSFSVLGQVAAKELFNDPEVATALAGLEKYMDAERIKKALGSTQ